MIYLFRSCARLPFGNNPPTLGLEGELLEELLKRGAFCVLFPRLVVLDLCECVCGGWGRIFRSRVLIRDNEPWVGPDRAVRSCRGKGSLGNR